MRRINLIALLVFLGILVWILTFDKEAIDRIQGGAMRMLSPFMKASTGTQELVDDMSGPRLSRAELAREHGKLKKEVSVLRAENQQLERLKAENEEFRRALRLQQTSLFDLISAPVISRDTSTWFSTLVIDKGYDQEIGPDSPVLTDAGLVGKTTRVYRNQSVVILLTDEKCQVAAKVEGSREQGICMGERGDTESTPYLKLKFLTREANLRPGARVYSSGLGGLFPSNILLGTVKDFTSGDVYGESTIEPAVDFGSLEHVFVISGIR